LKPTHYIKEFGTITIGSSNKPFNSSELEIDSVSFQSLTNFIEENQNQDDFDKAFSIYQKKGKRFIKVKNYVGVIETKQGVVIEILPKTFIGKNGEEADKEDSKKLLLTMLKTLKNSPFINLNVAHLKEQNNFPILEVFIASYLDELIKLTSKELRGDYVSKEENTTFLKGKLLLIEHIKFNSINHARFYCQFDEFNTNIPPNKLIKSTLTRLFSITSSNQNKKKIIKSLQHFDSVSDCSNIDTDIAYCKTRAKALNNYGNLINWSEVFLKNKSFTNFHGNSINQAILFPMEKLFESYIAFLLKKYCHGFTINAQDKRYCLISQNKDISDLNYSIKKFALKPDIVINNDEVIIDTKWKILNADSKKYDIKEADIYQMHAYGKRYQDENTDNTAPRLGLIYPRNPNFEEKLFQMRYGQDLLLDVIPFDFGNKNAGDEIRKIVNVFFKPKPYLYIEREQQLNIAAENETKYGK
jgi:5-methylcytosine-specific restriction enzyme subunit McrC